ncbi:MAG: 8-amino-7-oxononanoate synthase [Planctomycetota bacterium]|nr:MAG: 8-amino-7-oxononanoate synthase [Planctomycetota bacterium]
MPLFAKCYAYERAKIAMREGYYPYFPVVEENLGPEVIINGKRVVMTGSNNYLGLAHHPKVKEAAIEAIRRFGTTCSGSRYLNGTLSLHIELEEKLADFLNKEACLVFTTGFQTNQGTISPLVGRGEVIYCDRENHASIIEGCRLSFGTTKKFRHNDMEHLAELLAQDSPDTGKLIVVDGVFSMSGDLAPLPEIVRLAKKHRARIMVDDAHGVGVMGPMGRGTAHHFGVQDDVDLIMGTFSKSFASIGGFIAGEEDVIHYIKHHSRAMIFSASMSPPAVAAVLAALEIIKQEPERIQRLHRNAQKMREGFKQMGFRIRETVTPIVPVFIGDEMKTFWFCKALLEEGVYATPIISPAVPPDQTLVRTSYMATHTDAQLDYVLEVFEKLGKKSAII